MNRKHLSLVNSSNRPFPIGIHAERIIKLNDFAGRIAVIVDRNEDKLMNAWDFMELADVLNAEYENNDGEIVLTIHMNQIESMKSY